MLPPSGPPIAMTPISPTSVSELNDQEPELDPSDDEVSTRKTLAQSFEDLEIYPTQEPFLGKSSSMMFLQAALDIKQEYVVSGPASKQEADASQTDREDSPKTAGGSSQDRKGKGKERADEDGPGSRPAFPFVSKRPKFWLERTVRYNYTAIFAARLRDTDIYTYTSPSGLRRSWKSTRRITSLRQTSWT